KLRVVYMDRIVHDFAEPAHLAACAAGRQGRFAPFKAAFWAQGYAPYAASRGRDLSGFEPDGLLAIAKQAGLDLARFKADLSGPACRALLAHERDELDRFKVDGTPTFIINGHYVGGGLDKATLRSLIDARLQIAL